MEMNWGVNSIEEKCEEQRGATEKEYGEQGTSGEMYKYLGTSQ
jgi:hypothetical protein